MFEDITKTNRQGANLVLPNKNNIPIVRTTTNYKLPNQIMKQIHYLIIDKIKESYDNLEFNNALIEIYDSRYCSMGFHSDQALDLEEDSCICIFSCYADQDEKNLRKLSVKNKINGESFQIIMDHNSIITFSTNTNREHLHRIILENKSSNWLGITFRRSKTYINFIGGIPYFSDENIPLLLANDDDKKEFYKYRSLENRSVAYKYPEINYTISMGDILPIGRPSNSSIYIFFKHGILEVIFSILLEVLTKITLPFLYIFSVFFHESLNFVLF